MSGTINRRRLLAGGGAVAGGVFMPWIARTAQAQSKDPIKIGFPVPLSGIYGDYAKDQVNGAQLAIDQINAAGGLLGRKVELLVRDDQLDVQVVSKLCKELVENDKVDFLSGVLGEHTILAMNEASRQYKKIFVGINQSNDIFTGKNFNKYTFLEALTPYLSVDFLAGWAEKEFNRSGFSPSGLIINGAGTIATNGSGIRSRGAVRLSAKSSIRSSRKITLPSCSRSSMRNRILSPLPISAMSRCCSSSRLLLTGCKKRPRSC
jgi:hypothetical protein